jgi:AraC-like DNA-binding protein
MPDPNFPIKGHKIQFSKNGNGFPFHWHEHMELLYFTNGSAIVNCNLKRYEVTSGDLIVINGSELHHLECLGPMVEYYCIIYNVPLLLGQISDTCNTKYISPIASNIIIFKNLIRDDAYIANCIKSIITEFEQKGPAYELEIKSLMFHFLVILYRGYIDKSLSPCEYDTRIKNLERFDKLFKYIEKQYYEKITTSNCAKMLNITESHFCHLFKQITGKTFSLYINQLRVKKAEILLRDTSMNITEVGFAVGFSDISYFTRTFTKISGLTPTSYRKTI